MAVYGILGGAGQPKDGKEGIDSSPFSSIVNAQRQFLFR